jgi:DNA-binding IclR family transcriptional regulator
MRNALRTAMATRMRAETNHSGPIERYFQVLEVIAASNDGLKLHDIALLTRLPVPTAHRLVRTLVELGMLASEEGRNRTFRMGSRMWRMLHLGVERDQAGSFAQLVIDEISSRFSETSYVVRLDRDHLRSIAISAPDQGAKLMVVPGDTLPPHAAASAKAILAYQDVNSLGAYLRQPLERFTSSTITDLNVLMQQFAVIRQRGYATCFREIDENIMAYACPVTIDHVGVLYAIGLTGPITRIEKHSVEYWVEPMKDAARKLGLMLSNMKQVARL